MEKQFAVIEDYQSDNGLSYVEITESSYNYLYNRNIVMEGNEQEVKNFCNQYSYINPYELI